MAGLAVLGVAFAATLAASACGARTPQPIASDPALDPAIATSTRGGTASQRSAAGADAASEGPSGAAGSATAVTKALDSASRLITAELLRGHVAALASDELAGRLPGSPGDAAGRAYLVKQLAALGYEPGGADGKWEQPFDLVGVTAQMPKTWAFSRGGKKLSLAWWDQYIAGSGVQAARGELRDVELVFVGYGITAPEFQWDDYKGTDVRGKVLVFLNNDPDWDPRKFGGAERLYYGRWSYKYEIAASLGAAGAIIIHTEPSAGYPFQVVQSSWTGEQFELPQNGAPTMSLYGWVTEDAAAQLAQLAGKPLAGLVAAARSPEFRPIPLGIRTSISFTNQVRRAPTANVYGLLRGSDPKLRDEAVIITAHHDHIGVGPPDATGDKIYNGALDNAAGCAQVLGIARALVALPERPRRSTLILFVAAEEQGLLGSAYYAAHPTFPHGAIAANVNYDGGNIWGRTKDATFIGKGRSSIDAIVDELAARQGRIVKPDPVPDRGFFFRSDQFTFAKVGVPALNLNSGVDFIGRPPGWGAEQLKIYELRDYHQPSDELTPSWSFDGMIEDAQLGLSTALALANRDDFPTWTAGDEFEPARKAALAARAAARSAPAAAPAGARKK